MATSAPKKADELAQYSMQGEFMTRDQLDNFDPNNIDAFINALGLDADAIDFVASEYALTDKNDLVGVPIFIVEWEDKPSKQYGGIYVIVHAVILESNAKVVFADGGTGIAQQLLTLTEKRKAQGLAPELWYHVVRVPNGLVRSDYDAHDNAEGITVPAGTTYYLG